MRTVSTLLFSIVLISFFSCQQETKTSFMLKANADAKSAELIEMLESTNGGWQKIASKKDVVFTYSYDDKVKGIDLSTEKYIFDGEESWASYSEHNANVLPGKEGIAVQSLIGGKPDMTLAETHITDEKALGFTKFLRKANFYWFTMMYKLNEPGVNHKYMGQEKLNGITYDKVSIDYSTDVIGKEVNDKYILFYNSETHLVDQFLFSLPLIGVNEPVLRMELEYEEIEGILIATKRSGFFPNPETGKYGLGGEYISSGIKFNNGFTSEDFKL